MAVIQKSALHLETGDVVVGTSAYPALKVLKLIESSPEFGMRALVDEINPSVPGGFRHTFPGEVSVLAPDLTPAQQHAEELAKYARIMFDFIESPATAFYREYREAVTALLAAVEPPEPPTLAEALEILHGLADTSPLRDATGDERPSMRRALDLLERARCAKVI